MDCERINQMLSAYRDGELRMWNVRKVKRHLSSCRRCHEDYNEIVSVRQLLRSLPGPPASPAFWANTFLQIRASRRSPTLRTFYRTHQQTALGLSIVMLILGSLVLAPRKVDHALQQPPVIEPYVFVSLHASIRNEQPLADSGSLRYTIADLGHLDWDNDDVSRAD